MLSIVTCNDLHCLAIISRVHIQRAFLYKHVHFGVQMKLWWEDKKHSSIGKHSVVSDDVVCPLQFIAMSIIGGISNVAIDALITL